MSRLKAIAAGSAAIGLLAAPALAVHGGSVEDVSSEAAAAQMADGERHTALSAEELEWQAGPPTLPPGAEFAVLHGSPAKEGPFVIRLRFPADYEIPPHWHSKEEHVTVISGGFGMSTGETLNREAAPILEPGGFVRIPAEMPHYAWTDQETVVQINGIGPFDVNYVSAGDDPRS